MYLVTSETLFLKLKLIFTCRLLGHLYAAESLVLLNRLNEAIPHLHPDNASQLSDSPLKDNQEISTPIHGKQPLYQAFFLVLTAIVL